jgi:hypothetical protein
LVGEELNIIRLLHRGFADSSSAIRWEAAMGRRVWVPVVSGPLAPFAAGFESWLRSRAYSPSAAADRLYQFDQLSRWLEREGLGVGELTGGQAERFAASRRAAGLVTWMAPQSVMLPLGYLRALGVPPALTPVVARGPLEELLEDYRRTGHPLNPNPPCAQSWRGY